MKKLLAFFLAALLLCGCGAQTSPPHTTPETAVPETAAPARAEKTEAALAQIAAFGESPDDNYRTWYEIFVYSFCDSNGDGIGDLRGAASKLDYLQELGINGIWLMPIHPSQSYHKYDVADYYAIDPAYGTMEDMDYFLSECEERGIHVILDLVLNHTGNDHPWFLAAAEYLQSLPQGAEPNAQDCPYVDYYYFIREPANDYHQVPGTDSWYYEGKFSPHMPDLKLANPQVREEIRAIMEFWLGKGAAGFRLDAVKEFYSGGNALNVEVLAFLQETASAIKEDVYLVAEAWDNYGTIAEFYTSGMTSFFNFPFGNSDGFVISTVRGAGKSGVIGKYAVALENIGEIFRESNPNYIDAPFLSNHDVGRIASFCLRDEYKTKLAGAMNLMMGGSAFIYYGEEIGMVGSGNDPSKRAPMYWNAARDNGTTDPPPECELPESYPFGSLEEQEHDDNSVYNYYRQAIAIRKALPVISHGAVTAEEALNTGFISAQRKTWGEEECILLFNVCSDGSQVDLSAYPDWTLAASLSADGGEISLNGSTLTISPFGMAVLVPCNN